MDHRILVVDDIDDVARSLVRLLGAMGYDAKAALSGEEAIQEATTYHPDLAFIDIAMPGLDGYETVRQIRQRCGAVNTVFVALTGFTQPSDKRRAYEAGFDLHVAKPMKINTLEKVLELIDPQSSSSRVQQASMAGIA
jgi:CheY-like chemotaxis protein